MTASLSLGPRGAKYTISPYGNRATAGLTGTGLFYTVHDSKRAGRGGAAPTTAVPQRDKLTLGFFQRLMTSAEEQSFIDGIRSLNHGDMESALVALEEARDLPDAAWMAGMIRLRREEFYHAKAHFRLALDRIEDLGLLFEKNEITADQLVVLNDGAIEQVGTPIVVYNRPASVFVAEFIGSPPMNLMPGSIDEPGLVTPAGVVAAPSGVRHGDVSIGIRPEHLHPASEGPLRLKVRVVERLGASANAHGTVPGHAVEMIASLTGAALPAKGETLGLTVASENLHLFDPETGRSLHV